MIEFGRSSISLWGFDVHYYGLLIALGVLSAVLLACRRERFLSLPRDTALNIALVCVPIALICARAYYVIFSWDYYAAHPSQILNFRQGGLAVYGGVIGGVAAGYFYCRLKGISFARGLDLAAPSIALGQAIGRWGNFLNMEAYGAPVENPALQFFPVAVNIDGAWHYAAFFYESIWCALIVILILIAQKRRILEKSGDCFGAYIFLYGIERAMVEGLRTDSLMLGPLRVSQIISLLLVLSAVLVLARRRGWKKALLPAAEVLLLSIALMLQSGWFAAVSALILIVNTAGIYMVGMQTDFNLR